MNPINPINPMNHWKTATGQQKAAQTLENAATNPKKTSHAWLITGPPGSGRSELATLFAAALLAKKPENRPQTLARVKKHQHPDLHAIQTENLTIDIEETRKTVTAAHYTPIEGRHRVILIEDADRMEERTANVLLKALEEPPPQTIWILTAPSTIDLLPTIRSRTHTIKLVTPQNHEIAQLLETRDNIPHEKGAQAARLTQGHIGMARRLATEPQALERRWQTIDAALTTTTISDAMRTAAKLTEIAQQDQKQLKERKNQEDIDKLKNEWGKVTDKKTRTALAHALKTLEEKQKNRAKRDEYEGHDRILTDLTTLYRDILLHIQGQTNMINEERTQQISAAAKQLGQKGALTAIAAINQARTNLNHGVEPKLALEALFCTLATQNKDRQQ